MFVWNDIYWEEVSVVSDVVLVEVICGIVVGIKVVIFNGWKKIEDIVEGDKVLIFDDGL